MATSTRRRVAIRRRPRGHCTAIVLESDTKEVLQHDVTLDFGLGDSRAASAGFVQQIPPVETIVTSVATSTPRHQPAEAQLEKAPVVPVMPTMVIAPIAPNAPTVRQEEAQEMPADGIRRFAALFAFDVVRRVIRRVRRPLLWFSVLCMIAWMVSFPSPTVRKTFSPLCVLFGISRIALCVPVQPLPLLPPQTPPVNFERLVSIQGSTFEQLTEESAGGSELSIDVMKAEMVTKDLSVLVRHSSLRSRDTIADMLRTIAMDAKRTGIGLTKLNAKVVGAIDEVMAVNNYAMKTIEEAPNHAASPLLQAISPFYLGPTAEEIIAGVFALAMAKSEQTFTKLITEADFSRQNLEQLDVDIGTLHDTLLLEDEHITAEKDKVLGKPWTSLGGNKKAILEFESRQDLLDDLGECRKQAYGHVMATLRTLYAMKEDLEDMRERVAAPALLEDQVPVHVHVESIKNGLERLREERMRSRRRRVEGEAMLLNR